MFIVVPAAGPSWADILTAIATVVLAVFAIVTAWYARKAFLKQSKEVTDQAGMLAVQSAQLEEQKTINAQQIEVLTLQAAELRESYFERKREKAAREEAQAARVFAGAPKAPGLMVNPYVKNASDFPVYNAQLWYIIPGSPPEPEHIGMVMPDEMRSGDMRTFNDVQDAIDGTVLTFRDAAGLHWIRLPDGELTAKPFPPTAETVAQALEPPNPPPGLVMR
jgi:hypothetical protein